MQAAFIQQGWIRVQGLECIVRNGPLQWPAQTVNLWAVAFPILVPVYDCNKACHVWAGTEDCLQKHVASWELVGFSI